MERGNTKQEILEASLELFSVQGFEATSISQIADAVGIRKASLYSHFESKQEILDTLVKQVLQQYGQHSIFARANWEEDAANLPLTADAAVQMIQGQLRYILHDATIQRARKMLVIAVDDPEVLKKLHGVIRPGGHLRPHPENSRVKKHIKGSPTGLPFFTQAAGTPSAATASFGPP